MNNGAILAVPRQWSKWQHGFDRAWSEKFPEGGRPRAAKLRSANEIDQGGRVVATGTQLWLRRCVVWSAQCLDRVRKRHEVFLQE